MEPFFRNNLGLNACNKLVRLLRCKIGILEYLIRVVLLDFVTFLTGQESMNI